MWVRRPRLSGAAAVVAAVGVAVLVAVIGVVPVKSQLLSLQVAETTEAVPIDDPWASLWDGVASQAVPLSEQNVSQPFGGGSIASVTARGLYDDQRVYFLVEWADPEPNDLVNGQDSFSDAVALQFPGADGALPPYTMGSPEAPVNIWQWKAVWQRDIEGGFTASIDEFPDTYVDFYLGADDSIYNPARHVGNPVAELDHPSPVENLIAESFGTLTHADVQDVSGTGEWRDGRWRALFARDLTTSGDGMAQFDVEDSSMMAFAVWEGGSSDRNGQKSVAQFISLEFTAGPGPLPAVVPTPGAEGDSAPPWGFVLGVLAVFAVFYGLAEWAASRAGKGG